MEPESFELGSRCWALYLIRVILKILQTKGADRFKFIITFNQDFSKINWDYDSAIVLENFVASAIKQFGANLIFDFCLKSTGNEKRTKLIIGIVIL